jgi:hypothetical protein
MPMSLLGLGGLGAPHVTLLTLLLAIVGLWLINEIWQPWEGRFTKPWSEKPEHTVAEIHGRVMHALQGLPSGEVPSDPQLDRFHARLDAAEVSDWADTYCRDFEHNPQVLREIANRLDGILALGRQTGRSPALRHHGEAAAGHVPERHHAEWETAAVLAAWALVLREDLKPEDFELLYGPFTAVLPVAAPARPH